MLDRNIIPIFMSYDCKGMPYHVQSETGIRNSLTEKGCVPPLFFFGVLLGSYCTGSWSLLRLTFTFHRFIQTMYALKKTLKG